MFRRKHITRRNARTRLVHTGKACTGLFRTRRAIRGVNLHGGTARSASTSRTLGTSSSTRSIARHTRVNLRISSSTRASGRLAGGATRLSSSPRSIARHTRAASQVSSSTRASTRNTGANIQVSSSTRSSTGAVPASHLVTHLLGRIKPRHGCVVITYIYNALNRLTTAFLPIFNVTTTFTTINSPI